MQKIKFSKDQGSAFYKELKENIDAYFKEHNVQKTGNQTMLLKIVFYFSMVIFFYTCVLMSSSTVTFFSCYLLMGLAVLLTAFNVSHDAAHGVAVKSKKWNKILFQLSFQLQGNNAYVWGKNHNESHHLYTNIEGSDIDVLNNPVIRMTNNQSLKWYHKFQCIYAPFLYLLYSLNWFLIREILMVLKQSSRTIQVKMPAKEIITLIFFKFFYIGYMIVLPYYLLSFGLGTILLAFLLNHFMVSLIFTSVLGVSHMSDYVHHPEANQDGKLAMSWPKLQLLTSIDYNANSTFFNWTLGGFNAHALHHLLPDICHVHYLNILPIFEKTCKKYGFTYMNMPYHEAFFSHFRFLHKMGTQQIIEPKIFSYEK